MKRNSQYITGLLIGTISIKTAEAVKLGYAYDAPQVDRDAEWGYPANYRSNAEITTEVEDYLHDRGQYGDTFEQTAKKEADLEASLNEAYAKPSFTIPAGLLSYTYNENSKPAGSGLVQVGENTYLQTGQKWGIDEGQQYASNEDIMDYLAGPTKVAPR